ncbi:MAG: ABC transporter ATP-binding protein [Polyangia bacterium]
MSDARQSTDRASEVAPPERAAPWGRVRRALGFARAQRTAIAGTALLSVAAAAITATEPLVLRWLVDGLWQRAGAGTLVHGAIALGAMLIARELLVAGGSVTGWKARLGVQHTLLDATVGRLHALPVAYHRGESVGATMTKLDRGVQGLVGAMADLVFNLLPALIYIAIAAVMMLQLDRTLTLLTVALLPLPALIGVWAAPTQTARDQALLDRWRKIYGRFNEVLGGIATVKSFAMEQEEKRRFVREVDGASGLVLRGVGFDARVGVFQNLASGSARILVLAYGGYLAINGRLSVGTLLAFLGYLGGLTGPVQMLTGLYQTVRRATVALEAVFSILEAEDQVPDAADAREASPLRGEVVFEGVGFGYRAERPVLTDIDLRVQRGELVALVGASGGGKTTLMSLLQRLHDPERGTIRIDDVDIRRFTQQSLRQQIGVVMQDALLFDDTVGANIAYGRPSALPAEIEAAARAANAHDFIQQMPRGYDTFVGERGGLLSAGQRQRIAIARALLKDPPILILDEATSALDAEAEAAVQEALERLMARRTSFVIAHRLSTIVRAHRIVLLRDGRIAESGTHEELMRAGGQYARMVALQTRGLVLPNAA